MIGIENTGFLLGKGSHFSFKTFMDEENFVITAPKVGSRFMLQVFEKNEVDFHLPAKIYSVKDLEVTETRVKTTGEYQLDYDVEVYEKSLIQEWNKIINGTSKKNVVLLYRHPVERFKTAIVQDFAASINENRYNNIFYIKELLLQGGFSEELTMLFINDFTKLLERKTGMGFDPEKNYNRIYNQVEKLYKYLLKIYTIHAAKNGTHHYSEYLSIFYTLITLGIFKNVITINLDIKGNIEDYFEHLTKNKAKALIPYSNNENGKELVNDILQENSFIQSSVHNFLKEDLKIYSILNTSIDGL